MKFLLPLLALFGLTSCQFDASMLSEEDQLEYADLEESERSLSERLSDAAEALLLDPEDAEALGLQSELKSQLAEAQDRLTALVDKGVQGRIGPVLSLAELVPGVGAWLKYVLPLQGLAGLLFSRPRKHLLRAAKELNPFDPAGNERLDANGFWIPGVVMAPLRALLSILKSMGWFHSSGASASASVRTTE